MDDDFSLFKIYKYTCLFSYAKSFYVYEYNKIIINMYCFYKLRYIKDYLYGLHEI